MIRYMLDTNICIHLIKYRAPSVLKKLSSIPIDEVGVSSIVYAELCYGVAFSQKKKANEAALKDFLRYAKVLDWPKAAALTYGMIRADLRKKGTPIGSMDLLIAAHTLFLDSVLVTDNVKEFERIADIKVENWLRGNGVRKFRISDFGFRKDS